MASAAPPGHTDSEYVIGSAIKFECTEGHTYIHRDICAPYYIDYYILYINVIYYRWCDVCITLLFPIIEWQIIEQILRGRLSVKAM